jgi:thiosulfate dehydrogenase [quinone] large subunit
MSQKIYEPERVNELAPVSRFPRPALAASSAVLPARLFLGIVFLYAGIDKLTDPAFFDPSATGYIGNQLAGFATVSPIGGFLTGVAVPNATLFGWAAALGEVAIGLGTLAGLFSRVAALGGMVLSLSLWLSASWATDPFYLGSDLPYAMFFLVLAVGGPHPLLSLDGQIARRLARQKAEADPDIIPEQIEPTVTREEAAGLARRRFLAVTGATLAAGTFGVVAWGNALAERSKTTSPTATPPNTAPTATPADPVTTAPASSATTAPATVSASGTTPAAPATTAASNTTAVAATTAAASSTTAATSAPATTAAAAGTTAAALQGTVLTTLAALPSGTGKSFNTPDTNQPFLVIRGDGNTVHAFSAICTHQGCTVAFNRSANSIICPCHGAEYNPQTGAVTQGPAMRALATVKVEVDANGNVIYVTN